MAATRVVRLADDGLDELYSDKAALFCDPLTDEGRSQTRQSEADAADINTIVARFEKSGILPMTKREGEYLDVSMVPDYRTALEQVAMADEYFSSLPASSRAMFENNPAAFLDKLNDPDALQLLVDAGVIPKGEVKVREEKGEARVREDVEVKVVPKVVPEVPAKPA